MMMQGPGMMPPMQQPPQFDEAAARKRLMDEKDRKERQRGKDARLVYDRVEKQRNFKAAASCIWYVMAVDAFGLLIMAYACTGKTWANQGFIGTGIKTMDINTGLFDILLDIQCGKNWLEDKVCKLGAKYNGRHSITEFLGILCSTPLSQSCSDLERIQWASMMILMAFALCALFLLISCVCGYFYWNEEQKPEWRQRALMFGMLGPLTAFTAMGAWSVVMPDMSQMPRAWAGPLAGSNMFGYKPIAGPMQGTSFACAAVGVVILAVANSMLPCYVTAHPKEEEVEASLYDHMDHLEEKLAVAKYRLDEGPGSGSAASMQPGMGMQPGMQPGMQMYPGMQMQPNMMAGPVVMNGMPPMPPGMGPGGGQDFGLGPGRMM